MNFLDNPFLSLNFRAIFAMADADVIPDIVFYLKDRMLANNVQTPDVGIICGVHV